MFCAYVGSLIYAACKAHAPCYIAICGLAGSVIVFHIISLTARIKRMIEHDACFDYLYNFETFITLRRIQ
jgi:xanthosine utilization system XapX-like protein